MRYTKKRRANIIKRIRGGGNIIDNKFLVFYTCFFGNNNNIANKIPILPSEKYNCYFYSNNKDTLKQLDGTKWKQVFVDIPIKDSPRDSAMDSKELKACPHHFKELQGYKYQCYYDTKILGVNDIDIESYIRNSLENKMPLMMVNMHGLMLDKSKKPSVWDEYNLAMNQERYKVDSERYKTYIKRQLDSGLSDTSDVHYETSVILRKCDKNINEINEAWYKDIQDTGIECQISFCFLHQKFKGLIIPTPKRYLRPGEGGSRTDHYIFIDMLNNQGLGNQLYLYAVGLVLKHKFKTDICIIPSKGNTHSSIDYSKLFDAPTVIDLNISKDRINSATNILPGITSTIHRWSNTNLKPINSRRNLKTSPMCYQNYISIHKVIPEVKASLMKNEFYKDTYKAYNNIINSNESAFMHVRRGDYINKGWILPIIYYTTALDKLEKVANIKTIYIFSNDIKWCKDHESTWRKHFTKTIVYDTTANELEVLYMMILCSQGAIISGSTFSSWGALMGANMNKKATIVYPAKVPQYKDKINPYDFPSWWLSV